MPQPTVTSKKPRVWGIHDSQGPLEDNRPSGCGYHRIVYPFDQLRAHGWDARYRAGTVPAEELEHADIIVGERLDRHEVLGTWRRMSLRHKLIYEIDDNVYDTDFLNWMAHHVYSRAETQDAVSHCAAVSHLVTVTTEPLAEVMRRHNPNVKVIPNFIPQSMLEMQRPHRDRLTIGWAGGASHSRDVAMIAGTLKRFLVSDHPEARLHLVGVDFRQTVGSINVRFTPWESVPADYYARIDFDIALCPLTGSVFDRSKSNLKALEAAALGIPVVASNVPAYRDFVVDGVSGFLVSTEAQWRDRLRLLAADPELRSTMGAKARELARDWTIEGNWHRWADAYAGLL